MPTKKPKAEAPEAPEAPSAIEQVLALEEVLVAEASAYPDGPNSDAPKHALRGIASAISAFRNALETNKRLERP